MPSQKNLPKLHGEEPQKWGEVVELHELHRHQNGVLPVVFNFRPKRFIKLDKKRLSDWEKMFAQEVGFSPSKPPGPPAHSSSGGASVPRPAQRADDDYPWTGDPHESISGSDDGWDDCDYM